MTTHRFSASALIQAPAQDLYAIIADYHHGHPQILPQPPFVSLAVEQGGTGAGTVIRVDMRVLGQLQTSRAVVTEPEPGRVLVETNDNGYVTTSTVEPRAEGQARLCYDCHGDDRACWGVGNPGTLVRNVAYAPGLCQGIRAIGGGCGETSRVKEAAFVRSWLLCSSGCPERGWEGGDD